MNPLKKVTISGPPPPPPSRPGSSASLVATVFTASTMAVLLVEPLMVRDQPRAESSAARGRRPRSASATATCSSAAARRDVWPARSGDAHGRATAALSRRVPWLAREAAHGLRFEGGPAAPTTGRGTPRRRDRPGDHSPPAAHTRCPVLYAELRTVAPALLREKRAGNGPRAVARLRCAGRAPRPARAGPRSCPSKSGGRYALRT